MKKLLLALALMVSVTAHAAIDVNTRGLTESQKADLVRMADTMRAQQPTTTIEKSEDLADTVGKWANVGEQFGKMIGGAAKEVGIAVNEFIKTPVGIMTAGLIIFNYIGGPIIHVTLGLLLFTVGMSLVTWFIFKCTKMTVEYDTSKTNLFGNHPVKSKTRSELDEGHTIVVCFGYLITLTISIWTMFAW
jgi:hypothetical protein